jgi:hypothetical protein
MQARKFQLPNNEAARAALMSQGYDENKEYTFIDNEKLIEVQVHHDEDVYHLGYEIAKAEFEEKPQVLLLYNQFVPVLKKAIQKFSKDYGIKVNSIFIKEKKKENGLTPVTVWPTQGWILFNIYSTYGELLLKKKQKRKKSR